MLIQDFTALTDFAETPEGFLILKNSRLARSGVQKYRVGESGLQDKFPHLGPNDIVRIYRPPGEVFSKESLDSLAGKPITIEHPGEFVNAENIRELTVGLVGDTLERDGDFVKGLIRITHEEGVKVVQGGKGQLSVGYDVEIEVTSGETPSGEAFDAIQRNIRGNHVALVSRGRGGPSCRVHDVTRSQGSKRQEKHRMELQVVDCGGSRVEMSDAAVVALRSLTEKHASEIDASKKIADGLEVRLKDAETKLAEVEAKLDESSKKLTDAEARLTPEALETATRERSSLIDSAKKLFPKIKCGTLNADGIKRAALTEQGVDLKDKSDDYVEAAFRARVDIADSDPASANRVALQLANANEGNDPANKNPRADYLKRVSGAYRQEAK